MSSSENASHQGIGGDRRQSPQPAPPAPDQPAPREAEADETKEDDDGESFFSARNLRKRYREKRLAQGLPAPPPTPPPPQLLHPFALELLDAGGEIIHEGLGRWVVKHACGTKVTKFYPLGPRAVEAKAIRFVSEHTTIPVPRVLDVEEQYLTMERVEGENLKQLWPTLAAADKDLVVRQLRDYVGQLRALKSPDGRICAFDGGPAVDSRRFFRLEGGPFADEAAYNDFLVSDLLWRSDTIRDMIRSQMRSDHDIVLTHGDLHDINIMARPGVGVVAILDWELAGYYPEYHDLLKPLRGPDMVSGFYKDLLNVFPQRYEAEFLVDHILTSLSRH